MENFRKKILSLLIISLGLFIGSGVLFLYFIKDIGQKVQTANNYQKEIIRQAVLLEKIQILEKESKEAEKYLSSLHKALPNETEAISFEAALKNLISSSKLNISFRFGSLKLPQANEPKSYSFSLSVEGKITDLLNWLEAFQKLPYAFHFDQIEIIQTAPGSFQIIKEKGKQVTVFTGATYNIKILGSIYLR